MGRYETWAMWICGFAGFLLSTYMYPDGVRFGAPLIPAVMFGWIGRWAIGAAIDDHLKGKRDDE